jgi:hypothetical protein
VFFVEKFLLDNLAFSISPPAATKSLVVADLFDWRRKVAGCPKENQCILIPSLFIQIDPGSI